MPYTWTDLSWLTSNWFWRGTQSAIFYYISCAPCSKIAYQRKRRNECRRAEAEKAAEGEGYQQPLPSSTNPFWDEEITLGPGPPPKRSNKERDKGRLKERDLESGVLDEGERTGAGTGTGGEIMGGGPSISLEGDRNEVTGGIRRYQREDEVLWGREDESKASLEFTPASGSTSSRGTYYYARNPAVNDLHPPVVSTQPTSRAETLWMLQPPPKAKIMAGKEHRSRSSSGTSNVSRASSRRTAETSLGRQVGERLMAPKMEAGGQTQLALPSSVPMSKGPSNRSDAASSSSASRCTTIAQGQRHNRNTALIVAPSSSDPDPQLRQTPAPPPSASANAEDPNPPHHHLTRPPLSTIPSASLPQRQQKDTPPHLRPVVSTHSVSSLRILQELIPPAHLLNGKVQPVDGAVGVKLPPTNAQEDSELGSPSETDGCFPDGGWDFPRPGRKRTLDARARKRWSMEL